MTRWEYCILTRMSAGLDTKWFVNRVFQHHDTSLPSEMTERQFKAHNDKFEELHASRVFPLLPAILNLLGADGWELIDDMNTGMAGGEGWLFKRPLAERPRRSAPKKKPASGRRR